MALLQTLETRRGPRFMAEVSPPEHYGGISKLVQILDRIKDLDLNALAVTNNTGGSFKMNPLSIAGEVRRIVPNLPLLLHLTARDEGSARTLYELMSRLERKRITDVLVLRGDPTPGHSRQVDSYKYNTLDLVQFFDQFRHGIQLDGGQSSARAVPLDIFIAGHPEYPATSLDKHMAYQKQKVDKGAQGIVANIITEPERYFRYVECAARHGIQVPIVPSVVPLNSFKRCVFLRDVLKIPVPDKFLTDLQALSREDAQKYAVAQSGDIAEQLLQGGAPAINFNVIFLQDAAVVEQILRRLRGYGTLWEKYEVDSPSDMDYYNSLRHRF